VILPSLSVLTEAAWGSGLDQGAVVLRNPPVGFGSGVVGCGPLVGVPDPGGVDGFEPAGPVGPVGVGVAGGHGPLVGVGLVVGAGVVVGLAVDGGELGGGVSVDVEVVLGESVGDPVGEPDGEPDGDPVGDVGVGVAGGQDGSPGFANPVGVLGFTVRVGGWNEIVSAAKPPEPASDAPLPAIAVLGPAKAVEAVVPSATQPTADSTNRLPRRSLALRLLLATSPAASWSGAGVPAIFRMSLPQSHASVRDLVLDVSVYTPNSETYPHPTVPCDGDRLLPDPPAGDEGFRAPTWLRHGPDRAALAARSGIPADNPLATLACNAPASAPFDPSARRGGPPRD